VKRSNVMDNEERNYRRSKKYIQTTQICCINENKNQI
jgi:hypothetical protein